MSAGDPASSPFAVRASLVAYRLLLRLYPAAFRSRFGGSMESDFARMADEAWKRRGVPGLADTWMRCLRDLARSVPAAWREAGAERDHRAAGSPPRRGATALEDARWAARSLRRAPGFTLAATGVLALAVGGVATGFSVVDAYLFRGLPYPEADRLVTLVPPVVPFDASDPSVVEHPVTWDLDAFTLVDGERPRLVRSAWISPAFEEVFGIAPAIGRGFGPGDFQEGGPRVALLSHALWHDRYAGDPDILGRAIPLYASDRPDEAEVFTVVGVLPRDFWYHNAYAEMLVPLREPNPVYMARLRAGVPLAEAERALTAAARRAGVDVPPEGVRVTRFGDRYAEGIRAALTVLGAAVGLVLLLAAANACVLLLVRAAGRRPEFAVRQALGAARGRLGRQLLAEGMLLAGGATAAGLALAALLGRVLAEPIQARLGVAIPGGADALGLSPTVLLVTIAAGLGAGVAFGVAGLAGLRGGAVGASLGEAGRGASESRGARRLRDALVGGELALSLTLLVGAALALGSARHLATLDLGFEPRDRLTAQVNLRAAAYPDAASRAAFFDRLSDEASRLPGVASAGLIARAPFGWTFNTVPVEGGDGDRVDATAIAIGPGLLRALGVPVLQGRDFDRTDAAEARRAAIVSRRLAERLWGDRDPVGRIVRRWLPPRFGAPEEPEEWWTVVGVAGDVHQQLDGDAPDLWVPHAQVGSTSMVAVMHVQPGSGSPLAGLEAVVRRLDAEVAITAVVGLEETTMAARAPSRFLAALLAGFSAFALVLAVLGLYGVVSYAAARRSRDIALRMALGARAGQVVRLFLLETLPVVALGLAAGAGGAALLARLLTSELRGISPWDPATWATVAIVLAGAAMLAAWIPARRAARCDPAVVLRDE